MDSRQAISEFAGLLSVGSAALTTVLKESRSVEHEEVAKLLAEVEVIAAQLRDIGDASYEQRP